MKIESQQTESRGKFTFVTIHRVWDTLEEYRGNEMPGSWEVGPVSSTASGFETLRAAKSSVSVRIKQSDVGWSAKTFYFVLDKIMDYNPDKYFLTVRN